MKKMFKHWALFFLLFFSFFTRFAYLSYPDKVVFDEAHFGLYATKYLKGEYYFDIHPPLGKMMYALVAYAAGIQPGFYFEENSLYGEFNYLALRMLPAFIGSLLVILVYFFCLEIGASKRAAFMAGFLVLFNNALIVESRLILLNIFLLFFIFLSLFLFFKAQKQKEFSKKWYWLNLFCGFVLGAAISIKIVGFGAIIFVYLLTLFELLKKKPGFKQIALKFCFFFVIPAIVYIFGFYIHFKLLPSVCSDSCGFVLDRFLKVCTVCTFFRDPPPFAGFAGKFLWLQWLIANNSYSSWPTYPYESSWGSWPLMIRPFPYFFEKVSEAKTSYIYLIGNPIAWWLASLGIAVYFSLIVLWLFTKKEIYKKIFRKVPGLLILGYFCFWLPFSVVSRFTLFYLYFPALIFSTVVFGILFDAFLKEAKRFKRANLVLVGILTLIFIGFVFFSPLTYGIPLTEKQFEIRIWNETLFGIIPTIN